MNTGCLAETVRFELTDGCPSAVFKTAGLNRSPKSPVWNAAEMIAELHKFLPNQTLMVLSPVFNTSELNHLANSSGRSITDNGSMLQLAAMKKQDNQRSG
jgi:hypothetical protein